ncbi:hypothetical protein L211DRAFT_641266 [Terfezia boudieri ATCC MYA-4762]|uniref:Uncharacterized protein n=1 Tax=Terfezia boudieri ATCC MYA-4762 TaxID=1051890 RepID=A0A3N4LMT0_9PEZI|nr:hypothetical protein L211DRAFT_641266 [Terfezia boudieri ATCC MYA-4762]
MPQPGKSKGKGKKNGGGRQIRTPGLENASLAQKTPEPTQIPMPTSTPAAAKKQAVGVLEDLRILTDRIRNLETVEEGEDHPDYWDQEMDTDEYEEFEAEREKQEAENGKEENLDEVYKMLTRKVKHGCTHWDLLDAGKEIVRKRKAEGEEREKLNSELSTVRREREELRRQVEKIEEEKEQLRKTILELEGELSREKNIPKERFVEESEGMLTFPEEAEFWKKRCRVAEEFGFEAESRRDKIWEEVLEEQVKIGVEKALAQQQKKGKGVGELEVAMEKKQRKKKKGAKDWKVPKDTPPAKTEEDTEMLGVKPEQKAKVQEGGKEGEKDMAPVTSPITKKQATVRQVAPPVTKPQVAKHKRTYKVADNKYVDIKAFVVHGVPCHRPMADTIQDVKRTGIRGIIGARWLLAGSRRFNKTTSSVVIFLAKPVSFHVQAGHTRMMLRGRVRVEAALDSGSDSGSGW